VQLLPTRRGFCFTIPSKLLNPLNLFGASKAVIRALGPSGLPRLIRKQLETKNPWCGETRSPIPKPLVVRLFAYTLATRPNIAPVRSLHGSKKESCILPKSGLSYAAVGPSRQAA